MSIFYWLFHYFFYFLLLLKRINVYPFINKLCYLFYRCSLHYDVQYPIYFVFALRGNLSANIWRAAKCKYRELFQNMPYVWIYFQSKTRRFHVLRSYCILQKKKINSYDTFWSLEIARETYTSTQVCAIFCKICTLNG